MKNAPLSSFRRSWPCVRADDADVAKLNSTMAPLLNVLGTPNSIAMQTQDWITNVLYLAGASTVEGLNTTLAPDVHDHFYAASTIVSQHDTLRAPAAEALMDYFYGPGNNTDVSWFIIM